MPSSVREIYQRIGENYYLPLQCLKISTALKMGATGSAEKFVDFYQTIWHRI